MKRGYDVRKSGKSIIGIAGYFMLITWMLYVYGFGYPIGNRPFIAIIALTIVIVVAYSPYRKQVDRIVTLLFPVVLTVNSVFYVASMPSNLYVASANAGACFKLSDFFIFYMMVRWSAICEIKAEGVKAGLLFVGMSVISMGFATDLTYAAGGVLQFIKCIILYIWFSATYDTEYFRKYLLQGMEVAILYQSFLAILQKLNGGPLGLVILGESASAFRERTVSGATETGMAGTFSHASNLALFILFVVCFIGWAEKDKKKKYIILGISMIGMWLASSRTALVVLAFCFMYSLWKNRKKYFNKNGMLIIVLMIVVILLAGVYLLRTGRLNIFVNSDIQGQIINRTVHWEVAWTYIRKNWFLGYGVNNYVATLNSLAGAVSFYYTNPVHNVYLLYWFELGMVGIGIYVYILVKNVMKVGKFNTMTLMQRGAVLVVICTIVYDFTGWACSAVPAIYFLWISLGLLNNHQLSKT